MAHLEDLIGCLSAKEKQQALQFLRKRNQRGDVKNVALFQALLKNAGAETLLKRFGNPNKNAYHALRKRLLQTLLIFLGENSFEQETTETSRILKQLLAAQTLLERGLFAAGFKILNKTESQALALDQWGILRELYQTQLQWAHAQEKSTLPEVIQKSNDNLRRLQTELRLNQAYATIKSGIRNFPNRDPWLQIQETLAAFNLSPSEDLTYKALYQLIELTDDAAHLRSDYHTVSDFMEQTYALIKGKEKGTDGQVFYQLQVLYLIAILKLRIRQFSESTAVLDTINSLIEKHPSRAPRIFLEKTKVLRALNLNFTGNPEGALNQLQTLNKSNLNGFLVKSVIFFQQERFSEAYAILKQLTHSDLWYEHKTDFVWVVQKAIIEILLLIELGKTDLVESRLQSFDRKYRKRLLQQDENRVLAFMKLVSLYLEHPENVTSKAFKNAVENSFDWKPAANEDLFVMSFYAWLKAKMIQQTIYTTTHSLIWEHA